MIPRYNSDLTGESNLNVSKRRVINKLMQTYSEYPEVYMTENAYKENRKLETILNTIFTNMDVVLILFSELIDGIDSNGMASEFTDEGEYNDHLSAMRDLTQEQIPKLKRGLEIVYSNIDNLKLKDFNKLNDYIKEIRNSYNILKGLVIKDINADNLYDFFKFLEPNVTGYLKGGVGKKGRSGRKKKEPEPSKSEDIMKYLTKKGKKGEEDDEEEKEEEELQEEKSGVEFGEDNIYEYEPDESLMSDVYNYSINRASIREKWSKLIDLLEGVSGIFNRWFNLVRIYNEKRPSLKPNPKQSMREEVDEEMEGGFIYDASLPYYPNKYI